MRLFAVPLLSMVLACSGDADADADDALRRSVNQRLHGDRTGACMAVALVEKEHVARVYTCANERDRGRIGPASAFEIGSVTKTMTAALLADLIGEGKASLDDPIAGYLPAETRVPTFEGGPILLRHLVTHTSGLPALPARMPATDPQNPYADLTPAALLASLGDVKLTAAPGTHFAYSNFAMMVLSYAVAQRAGSDLETLLHERLFAPLGMQGAYVTRAPDGIVPAIGHRQNGAPTPAWTFPTDLAGVGGVRATLDDMVRYVRGQLGAIEAPITPALRLTQQPVHDTPPVAMNWRIERALDREARVHDGGTGGFSSLVAFEPASARAVIVLSDTSWNSLGGLQSLALHLLDARFPLGKPRTLLKPDAALLAGLVGEYALAPGVQLRLTVEDGVLHGQATGQSRFAMDHDSDGDFFARDFDAVLRPRQTPGGYTFTWFQGGVPAAAERISAR